MAENRPKRGRKVRSISNSGQNFFYVIKPKIDDFIPKLRPPKNTPFFWGGGKLQKATLAKALTVFRVPKKTLTKVISEFQKKKFS